MQNITSNFLDKTSKPSTWQPTSLHPARQFLDDCEKDGPAYEQGLRKGDYIININGSDVRSWGHDEVAELIRSNESIKIHVITVKKHKQETQQNPFKDRPKSRTSTKNGKYYLKTGCD